MGARRGFIVIGLVASATLATASPALAVDHLYKVKEVFTGDAANTDAHFVELQGFSNNQHQIAGNRIVLFDQAENVVGTYTFAVDAPSTSTNQRELLLATPEAESLFGVTSDLTIGSDLSAGGGKACYEDVDNATAGMIDCFSWGAYSGGDGSATPGAGDNTGTPFHAPTGILSGLAPVRDISGGTLPSALDAADDTGNSLNDFDTAAVATPMNFGGATTSTAGQASVDGDALTFTAAPGVANRLSVTRGPGLVTVQDSSPVSAGAGCENANTFTVHCPRSGLVAIEIDTGTSADIITTPNGLDVTVDAGIGNDRITTRGGDDDIVGGDDDDRIQAGLGADNVDGGEGSDTASYGERSAANPVTVTIGVGTNDGNSADESGGRRDDVMGTVERVIGGNGSDSLTGSGGPDQLTGGPGGDQLHGLGGNDVIRAAGDATADTATCGAGNDRIFADAEDIFPVSGPDDCEIVP